MSCYQTMDFLTESLLEAVAIDREVFNGCNWTNEALLC